MKMFLLVSLYSLVSLKLSKNPPNTFAICKEIKNNTGYTCTVYDYDEIYIFIIRRQAIIVKRHFRVDGKLHLITLFLVVFSYYWYDHLPKKRTLFVPLPTVSSINSKNSPFLFAPSLWMTCNKNALQGLANPRKVFLTPKNNLFQQHYQKNKKL